MFIKSGQVYFSRESVTLLSDDRIKFNETIITNRWDLVFQLKPQKYDQIFKNKESVVEAGFIGQN